MGSCIHLRILAFLEEFFPKSIDEPYVGQYGIVFVVLGIMGSILGWIAGCVGYWGCLKMITVYISVTILFVGISWQFVLGFGLFSIHSFADLVCVFSIPLLPLALVSVNKRQTQSHNQRKQMGG